MPLTPLPEEDEDAPIPLGGSNVFVPRTEKESNYMYDRKIMTVNHMHTTLAFLTLVRHMDRTGATPDDMVAGNMACKSLPLIKFDPKVDPKVSQIWCWGVAQCLLLQSEHDKHTMMKAHKVDNMDDLNSEVLKTVKENLYR